MKGIFITSAILILFTITESLAQKPQKITFDNSQMIQPGVMVVKMKPGYSLDQSGNARAVNPLNKLNFKVSAKKVFNSGANNRVSYKSGIDFSNYYKLSFDKSLSVERTIARLSEMEGVEYAEPLYMYRVDQEVNDPGLSNQTYLDIIRAQEAWNITTGSQDVVVAVIDAGIDYEHDDLKNKIYLNESEIPDNGIDDDGDGYIDNYLGWDFAGADFENIVPDNDPLGKENNVAHGTWVAGAIAAEPNNEVGIAGVGYNTNYLALKCSSDNDTRDGGLGFLFSTLEAVVYAADQGADVINMSYGGSTFSQFAQDVMIYAAIEKDVVLVASAGNSGVEQDRYPAAYEHVIAVAATENDDTKANFSNFGDYVDISAPGVSIYTTSPDQDYAFLNGTSFSAPLVAGAAALLRAQYPDYNQFQIATLLLQSADTIDHQNNDSFAGKLGTGRLNVENALQVTTPALKIQDISILNQSGDIPISGETANLNLTILNELDPSSANTFVKVTPVNGNPLEIDTVETVIGSISEGQSLSVEPFLSFDIPADLPFNERIDFEISTQDPDARFVNEITRSFIVNPLKTVNKIAPYTLSDGGDFESNTDDFRSAQILGGIDLWELGEPQNQLTTVNSGTNAWKTDLDGNLPQSDFQCVLQSPVYDLSEAADYRLSFYKSMDAQFCNAPMAAQMQVSTDGGLTWSTLGTYQDPKGVNWYNKDPNADETGGCAIAANVIANQEGWIVNVENEFTEYNISEFAGNQEVAFRFLFAVNGNYDGGYDSDGFMIDDFQILKEPAKAEFFVRERAAYVGQSVHFEYLSNGATSFEWQFGDGGTSANENPTYSYNEPGTYDVILTITNDEGSDADTLENYITILPNLPANFSLADGGDMESNPENFGAFNVAGTMLERGASQIEGKEGTSSGDFAWVFGIEEDNYENDSEAYLYTPGFDFSIVGNYTFNFAAKYSFEDTWDGFIVEYSFDKGNTWKKLNDVQEDGWYNTISDPQSVFGDQVPIFSGSTNNEFIDYSVDVSMLSGHSSVSFRFKILTDAATTDIGIALDDVFVTAPEAGPIEVGFSADGITGCAGQEIVFRSTSTGSIDLMIWDFGENAEPPNASGPGPHTVLFDSIGTNSVTLTASNQDETKTETLEITTAALHTPSVERTGLNQDGSVLLQASEGDGYRWYFENDLIEGENNRTINASSNGIYTAEVSVEGCFRFASNFIDVVAGLEDFINLDLYPNPTEDFIYLDRKVFDSPSINYTIYQLSGKIEKQDSENLLKSQLRIKVRDLSSGIYILLVEDGTSRYISRFVKN